MQVQVVMFEGPPQPLDKDVVLASAAAVHADVDVVALENLGEAGAGKLGALVGVEDLWLAVVGKGLLEGLHTEIRLQGVGQAPGENLAAVPVHDRHQIHIPVRHGHVGDVRRPRLIGVIDGQVPEQIGVNPMLRMRAAGVRLGVDRLDAHQPHQPLDAFAVDPAAMLAPEMPDHRTAAVEGGFQVLLVNQAHQLQVIGIDRLRGIVERRAAQCQQLALS